ncbi:hypothetical protein ACQPZQ_13460 [Pseudonocardia sp. CA-142604]|uniref:hypothetical protein n=1 Tax=Pseudonocardia sp. CA-142604 TaxID=3240024 RepID=UPI003D90E446
MSNWKRRLVLAATATTLAAGAAIVPAATAMASPLPAGSAATSATQSAPQAPSPLCADQWGMMTWCS